MSVAVLVHSVADVVVRLNDEAPEAEDVKAGWTAFVLFLLLIGAVVLLAFSLVKQLRKAQAAKDAGVYGDDPDSSSEAESSEPESSEPENHSSP